MFSLEAITMSSFRARQTSVWCLFSLWLRAEILDSYSVDLCSSVAPSRRIISKEKRMQKVICFCFREFILSTKRVTLHHSYILQNSLLYAVRGRTVELMNKTICNRQQEIIKNAENIDTSKAKFHWRTFDGSLQLWQKLPVLLWIAFGLIGHLRTNMNKK